mgnify:CR=1 FL=1
MIKNILKKRPLQKEDLVILLGAEGEDKEMLFDHAAQIKKAHVDNVVYFRGLVEFSNICSKNCYYCGIRSANKQVDRYNLSDKEITDAARYAYEQRYGSLVLQSGEVSGKSFTNRIARLLREIKKVSDNKLGITLSCGEQDESTYREWFQAGAHRYLLRIEASNPSLYHKIHPVDDKHDFGKRLNSLKLLQGLGYQTGTGVMIGLPFQTLEHLADDLLFMQALNIDMVGMGPYVEHKQTPLYQYKDQLLPIEERLELTYKMIAILRIMMPDINMAAATALQAINPFGREKALKIGANVIMPNITPGVYRDNYKLYENKPCTDDNAEDCTECMVMRIGLTGHDIGYDSWGDSKHFFHRTSDNP